MLGAGALAAGRLGAGRLGIGALGIEALGGGLSLTACTRTDSSDPLPPDEDVDASVDPDGQVRAAALTRERALLAAYDAALLAPTSSAGLLRRLRAEHAEHLAALGDDPAASPAPSGSPAASATPSPSRARGLTALRAAERSAARGHARDALGASRQLAPLLASLAAAETSHLEALA